MGSRPGDPDALPRLLQDTVRAVAARPLLLLALGAVSSTATLRACDGVSSLQVALHGFVAQLAFGVAFGLSLYERARMAPDLGRLVRRAFRRTPAMSIAALGAWLPALLLLVVLVLWLGRGPHVAGATVVLGWLPPLSGVSPAAVAGLPAWLGIVLALGCVTLFIAIAHSVQMAVGIAFVEEGSGLRAIRRALVLTKGLRMRAWFGQVILAIAQLPLAALAARVPPEGPSAVAFTILATSLSLGLSSSFTACLYLAGRRRLDAVTPQEIVSQL